MPITPPTSLQGFTERKRKEGEEKRERDDEYHHGVWDRHHGPRYHPAVATTTRSNWGHLKPSHLGTDLLHGQKLVLAMSRAEFLADMRSSRFGYAAAAADVVPSRSNGFCTSRIFPASTSFSRLNEYAAVGAGGGEGGFPRGTTRSIFPGEDVTGGSRGWQAGGGAGRRDYYVNGLLVGACIFRLDKATLRPAVLLVRRPPLWWTRRDRYAFTTMTTQRQRQTIDAERWELPGGKVADYDFCISAAIDRLVERMLGLKVMKIMVMLSSIVWNAEVKVLLWDRGGEDSSEEGEGDGVGASPSIHWTYHDDDNRGRRDGYEYRAERGDEHQIQIASPNSPGGDAGWRSSPTALSMSVYSNDEDEVEETRNASSSPPPTSPWPWPLTQPSSASPPDSPPASESPLLLLPPRHREQDHEYGRDDGEHGNRTHTGGTNNFDDIFAYPYHWATGSRPNARTGAFIGPLPHVRSYDGNNDRDVIRGWRGDGK
ncbi:hypothetical protein NPX13_g6611 [Xylaria arbuscula]|uniref:Uncharacterized protein n=1 Tax=Xylaria arbuscula TaxID=114810 RepID=A0A9W8NBW5_9PEZI|nr:hypothetical protein NPX13_g6611 [Xylaria arbuscula]